MTMIVFGIICVSSTDIDSIISFYSFHYLRASVNISYRKIQHFLALNKFHSLSPSHHKEWMDG